MYLHITAQVLICMQRCLDEYSVIWVGVGSTGEPPAGGSCRPSHHSACEQPSSVHWARKYVFSNLKLIEIAKRLKAQSFIGSGWFHWSWAKSFIATEWRLWWYIWYVWYVIHGMVRNTWYGMVYMVCNTWYGMAWMWSHWFHIRALIARSDAVDTRPHDPDHGLVFGVIVQYPVSGLAWCLVCCLVVWRWGVCMECLGEDCLTNILLASPAWNSIFWYWICHNLLPPAKLIFLNE